MAFEQFESFYRAAKRIGIGRFLPLVGVLAFLYAALSIPFSVISRQPSALIRLIILIAYAVPVTYSIGWTRAQRSRSAPRRLGILISTVLFAGLLGLLYLSVVVFP